MLKINVQVAHMRHPLPGCRLAGASLWSAFPTPHAHGQQPHEAPQAGLALVVLGWQAHSSMHGWGISDLHLRVFLSHLISSSSPLSLLSLHLYVIHFLFIIVIILHFFLGPKFA